MKRVPFFLLGFFLLVPFVSHGQPIAIENTTVYVRPNDVRKGVSLLVDKGVVTQVGKTVRIPQNAKRIDGTGKVVTAGLIATSSYLGMVEVDAVQHTNEGQFASDTPMPASHAAYRVVDGFNPDSSVIPIARNGGITSSIVAPTGSLISGQSAWLTLKEGTVQENTVSATSAMHVTLGSTAIPFGDGARGMALARLRSLLLDARHYQKNKAAYHRGQTRPYGAHYTDLESLQKVLDGTMPLVATAHRKSDIHATMELAKEFQLRLVIEGATEAWMLAPELAVRKIPVIVNPKDNLPSSFDRIHVVDDNATRLAKAGVPVIIASPGAASSARALRQLAGLAVGHGLAWDTALAAITSTPAMVFGKTRGVLTVGAPADLVVWSGDPLEMSSIAEHIIVDGIEQSRQNRQTELLRRYR